jgi:hypothetical protein
MRTRVRIEWLVEDWGGAFPSVKGRYDFVGDRWKVELDFLHNDGRPALAVTTESLGLEGVSLSCCTEDVFRVTRCPDVE